MPVRTFVFDSVICQSLNLLKAPKHPESLAAVRPTDRLLSTDVFVPQSCFAGIVGDQSAVPSSAQGDEGPT